MKKLQTFEEFKLNEGIETQEILNKIIEALPDLEKLIEKESKIKSKLQAKILPGRRNDYFEIVSENLINTLSPLGKVMFNKIHIEFSGSTGQRDGQIWFSSNVRYTHPGGGSNGTTFIWDSIWFDDNKLSWITGRKII